MPKLDKYLWEKGTINKLTTIHKLTFMFNNTSSFTWHILDYDPIGIESLLCKRN